MSDGVLDVDIQSMDILIVTASIQNCGIPGCLLIHLLNELASLGVQGQALEWFNICPSILQWL